MCDGIKNHPGALTVTSTGLFGELSGGSGKLLLKGEIYFVTADFKYAKTYSGQPSCDDTGKVIKSCWTYVQ